MNPLSAFSSNQFPASFASSMSCCGMMNNSGASFLQNNTQQAVTPNVQPSFELIMNALMQILGPMLQSGGLASLLPGGTQTSQTQKDSVSQNAQSFDPSAVPVDPLKADPKKTVTQDVPPQNS